MDRCVCFSIIMAAGKGNRMQCPGQNKVCLEIGGVPAVVRAIDTYEACGVGHHIAVVGELAEQVMATVGERYPNCTYAYQPVPLGTGNAAKVGSRVLADAGYEGAVFVTAGDKYFEPRVVEDLLKHFGTGGYDLVLVAGPKEHFASSGRVLTDDEGAPTSIVEVSEIRLSVALAEMQALLAGHDPVDTVDLGEIAARHFPNEKKARVVFGEFWHLLQTERVLPRNQVGKLLEPLRATTTISVYENKGARQVPASEIEDMTSLANLSAYVFRASALYHSLAQLTRDNAQHEEFLTDTIKVLASDRLPDGSARYRLGIPADPRSHRGHGLQHARGVAADPRGRQRAQP